MLKDYYGFVFLLWRSIRIVTRYSDQLFIYCGPMPQMNKEKLKKRSITTGDTVKVMQENGMEISEKDAEIILDFLYFLAKLTVDQYVNDMEGKK
jgi:hypothetical protein